jgi:glutaminyl-peptide cyclotransferase
MRYLQNPYRATDTSIFGLSQAFLRANALLWMLWGLVLSGAGCDGGPSKKAAASEAPLTAAPVFSADTAMGYLKEQLAFGPRVPGSAAHRKCGDWLVSQLKLTGAEVIEQTAQVQGKSSKLALRNIIARYYPDRRERLMLSAHWDSRNTADREDNIALHKLPVPGANDGASGVAVLLEIAQRIARTDPGIGVDIVLWDLEDQGQSDMAEEYCLGSTYWAKHLHQPNYTARFGILLDMVGARGAVFSFEETSTTYASKQMKHVWRTAHRLGYGQYFSFQSGGAVYDDHVPINTIVGIPTLDIIHRDAEAGDFFPHHHRTTDDLSQIDPATLKAVGQTVLQVVYDEGAALKLAAAPK